MALHGSLRELRLGDVLQTVQSAGGRGLLRVRNGGRRAILHLSDRGVRILEPEVLDDRMIVEALVRRGVVQADVAQRARVAAESRKQSPLEPLLVGGSVDRARLDDLLVEAAEDAILDVLAWQEGDFRFQEDVDPASTVGRVAEVTVESKGLLLRAAQRADEQQRVAERIGPQAVLVMPLDASAAASLEGAAPRLAERIDGRLLLDEIAVAEGWALFEARKAAAALVETGAARLPTGEELSMLATAREQAGDLRAAFALVLQWESQAPEDPAPAEVAAGIAARAGRVEEEAAALRTLGHRHMAAARPDAARAAFEALRKKRPGDRDALEGLRDAARALDDQDAFAKTSRELAEAAMAAGDAAQAATWLQELLEVRPDDLDARLLRTKAVVRLGERAQAVRELEILADALPSPCKTRVERAVAAYGRETVAQLAPERTDLLRRFSGVAEATTGRRRRVVIVGALLLVASGVGIVFWPKGASGLLERAKDAAARGDVSAALGLIDEIELGYSDSSEATEASALRARLVPPTPATSRRSDPKATEQLKASSTATLESLPRWPDADAVEAALTLAERLRVPTADAELRRAVAESLRAALPETVAALRRAVLARRDALDSAAVLAERPPATSGAASVALERAREALDKAWVQRARRAVEVARRLASSTSDAAGGRNLGEEVRFLEDDVATLEKATASRADDVVRLRRETHRLRIDEAYDRARTEGIRLLARGELANAEGVFATLAALVDQIHTDADLTALREVVERRGILQAVQERTATMQAVREGLRAAQEAERTGNLRGAASQYAKLVRQFPEIRFDTLFTVPLRVTTVPPAATVSLNGRAVERTPAGMAVVRYGWGSAATVSVAAEGYEPASVVLETSTERPDAELRVQLAPRRRWTGSLAGTVEAPLLGLPGGDVVVSTRAGRVERRNGADGSVEWSVETRCVEGVRGRPVANGDVLWVPLLDGRAGRIMLATGSALPPLQLRDRPVGDAAASEGKVAFMVEGSLAIFGTSETPTYVALGGTPTAGVLSALGAFWVGTASGVVVRVDGKTLAVSEVRPEGTASIVGLAADAERVYALADDGTLHAVAGASRKVAWSRPGLGDVVGRPAVAAGVVAIADRTGRVRIFGAADGAAKGVHELGSVPRDGLAAVGARLAAALSDGRLWVYDVAAQTVIVDAPLEGTARLAPADLGDGSVAVPANGNGLAVVPLAH